MIKRDDYKLIPIYTKEKKYNFINNKLIPIQKVEYEGIIFHTHPLAANRVINLIEISSNDELVRKGLIDPKDKLSTDITLENIYISFSSFSEENIKLQEVVCIPIDSSHHIITKKYHSDTVIEYFVEKIVFIDMHTKSINNTNLCFLKDRCGVLTEVSFKICLSFTVDMETGLICVVNFNISTEYIKYSYSTLLNNLLNVINSGEFVGYTVSAYTNINRT